MKDNIKLLGIAFSTGVLVVAAVYSLNQTFVDPEDPEGRAPNLGTPSNRQSRSIFG